MNDSRSLTVPVLRQRYHEALETGSDAAYRKRRWGRAQEFASWLSQAALAELEPTQALSLYRASGGRESVAFAATPIEEVRDTLDFLLYDTIKLEGRFDECASPEGAYKLPGAGREFVSWLLCLRNPSLLGVWNANSERLLKLLNAYPESMNRGPVGIRYLDLIEALARLGGSLGLRDFMELDVAAFIAAGRRSARRRAAESGNGVRENGLA